MVGVVAGGVGDGGIGEAGGSFCQPGVAVVVVARLAIHAELSTASAMSLSLH
jgi:hypothetical protein